MAGHRGTGSTGSARATRGADTAGADGVLAPNRWGPAALLTAIVSVTLALLWGGSSGPPQVPGLSEPGPLTDWGLPIARVVLDGAIAVTIGFIGLAALIPTRAQELDPDAVRALRRASWSAVVLVVAAACTHLLTFSDLLGEPLISAVTTNGLGSYTSEVAQGRAYAAVVVIAAAIVVATRLTTSRGGVLASLLAAVAAALPLGLIGHGSTGDYHQSASASLLIHLVGLSAWIGGLVALSWYAAVRGRHLVPVTRQYSQVALGCFVLVGASGLVNAVVRLENLGDLFTTGYGLLLTIKVEAYVALLLLGLAHRRRTIPDLEAGRPRAFRRLAAGELLVMAVAAGVGIALSRTPPPVSDRPLMTAVRELIGFAPPPPIDLSQLFLTTYPDAVFFIGVTGAAALYLGAVRRLRKRGDRWPLGRTVAFLAGLATIAVVQLTGVMTYSMVLFSVHMAQHMTLMMISPALLVLGAPITLALRALRPATRGTRGLREWLLIATSSRVARFLTHPLVALPLFVSGAFVVYFTPLFEAAMRNHTGHLLMSTHFLVVGYLYFEMLIGVDPLPSRPAHPLRVVIALIAASLHAVFGLAVMESSRLIAGDYYQTLRGEIGWLPDVLEDQRLAGSITWGFGEIPALLVIVVIVVQWARSDDRAARRFDRAEGSQERARTAYNAYLGELAAQGDPGRQGSGGTARRARDERG